MSYRFNSGYGGVTCDICNILFDEGLSFEEYKDAYGPKYNGKDGDFCWKCIYAMKKKKQENKQEEK